MDIININVGQAGSRIGNSFIQQMYSQHFSQNEQPEGKYSIFFGENNKNQYARSIFIDKQCTGSNQLMASKTNLYKKDNIITQKQSSDHVFGTTRYHFNQQVIQQLQNQIRKQVQISDSLGGFIYISSLAGGAGSGITSLTQTSVRQKYRCKITQSFRLVPQLQIYSHPLQIYNSVFSINCQVQNSDMTLLFDNGAPSKMFMKDMKTRPSIQELNHKISQAISDTTIPFRFKGELNASQCKIATNSVLFPRLHFLTFSKNFSKSINPLTSALSLDNFFLTNYWNQPNCDIFNVYAGVRSNMLSERDISPLVRSQFQAKSMHFIDWIPDSVHISLHQPIKGKESASIIANSRHFMGITKKIAQLYTLSFRRRAFLHYYTGAGMDEMQFTENQSNLNDLNSQYQPPSGAYEYDQDE